MIQTIFLKENEKDIFQSLQNQGIDTKVFENKLADLFNRVYNNFVGYYIFRQDDIVYKLIVLPKTIDKDSEEAEKDFVNYLLHYHRVNTKYKFDETKQIKDSLLSLAFKENNTEDENSHLPLDEFEFYKYKSILERIESFFKKHKNYKKANIDYKSQGIKYKLNLAKNIKELDKTKIHQIQSIDMMYSTIATISYNALKVFVSKRVKNIEEKYKKQLIQDTKKVINFIAKKYTIDKNYKLTLSKLNNYKTTKVFSKKSDTKQLLVDIKSLFGFEQMYEDKDLVVSNRYDLTTTSFFIDPILFYEWYVYDILCNYTNDNIEIEFDKKNKTTQPYYLIDKNICKYKTSNPDYVLTDKDKKVKIVIDAKWKNIFEIGKIQSSDYMKLKLDSFIQESEGYKVASYLVYPNLYITNDRLSVNVGGNSYFDFNILQIDMKFDKDKLDFTCSYNELDKQIQEEKKEVITKSSSEQYSNEVANQRTELIIKLLNSEDLENKEEVFNELDEKLLENAERLNNEIEEKLSQEVIEILENYNDVLEEDSKKFLRSSSSIYNYYKDRNYEHFDYSMPGSGLWKLVELELNTSFSWFLRIKSHVCNKTCPWTNISNSRRSITQDLANGKRVKLNQYEHGNSSKLHGLMLGGISLLLEDSNTVVEFDEITELDRTFFVSELISFVKDITDLRNEHSHIKAMSLEKFEELYNILFMNEENIKKLLDMKTEIRSKINE